MPITCPACNKAGQTDAACQRCGCELSHLHEIAGAAAAQMAAARAALVRRDWRGAIAGAEHAWRLRHTGESAQLAWIAAAASGDTPRALRWRERAAET